MMHPNKKAGTRNNVRGQQRVSPGCEAREVASALRTNAPYGKHVLTRMALS